jgi:hypothetical protein
VKVLLDECVDSRLAGHLGDVDVTTVAVHGRGGITNGKLLALAAAEFDVFVTVDRNLSFQQHLPKFDIAVVLLVAKTNRFERTLSKSGTCSARATNKFARASLGVGRRSAAHAGR